MLFQSHRMWVHDDIAGVSLISPNELALLVRHIPEDATSTFLAVEIGTHCGASAAWVLDRRPNIRWLGIDTYAQHGLYGVQASLSNRRRHPQFNCFIGTAQQWLSLYSSACRVSLLLVDGLHTYEGCRADLEVAAQVAETVAVHDYGVAGMSGLQRAVDEMPGWNIVERERTLVILKQG